MHRHFQRAQVLYSQSRMAEAAQELRQALLDEPQNAMIHATLALCLSDLEQFNEATEEARMSIHLAPDEAFCHYALAAVMVDRNRFAEAAQAIAEAIRLDPADADYRAKYAETMYNMRRWGEALEAADAGLALDPEHIHCTNIRAMALVKLGRKQEAAAVTEGSLARMPDNAWTHATRGWTCLEQNQTADAMKHFREALRLEPELEFARRGIIEAIKSRNPIYRLMLNYFLWMGKLSGKAQWGFIIGLYVLFRVLSGVARNNPALSPYLTPLLILYIVFVVLSWTAVPVFNLLLRLHPLGKMALSQEEKKASNWIAICLLGALAAVGVWLWTQNFDVLFFALVCGLMMLPISATFNCDRGWPRRSMAGYTLTLAGLGFLSAGLALLPTQNQLLENVGFLTLILFVAGIFGMGFVANFLVKVRPEK